MVTEPAMGDALGAEEPASDHVVWNNDTYKRWKKNSKYLYDVCLAEEMDWPSLTVDWFRDRKEGSGKVDQKLLIGTQTGDGSENYLKVMKLTMPIMEEGAIVSEKYNSDTREVGSFGGGSTEVKLDASIVMVHEGEVNVARVNPNNEFLIASKSPNGSVLVFDYRKHPSFPTAGDKLCHPQFRLAGHTEEGFALSWDPHSNARLLSGANDGKVCVWELPGSGAKSETKVDPIFTREEHIGSVNDVAWHAKYANLFASVGDDSRIITWDTRDGTTSTRPRVEGAHDGGLVNCVSFNPFNEFLLATGGSDDCVALWDMRNMTKPLCKIDDCHAGCVDKVTWCPQRETVLASSGTLGNDKGEKTIKVWDIARIGEEQNDDDAMDGPPELLFAHMGHVGDVNDMCWNPNDPWTMASVDGNNYLHCWKMDNQYCCPNEQMSMDALADHELE
jgi:WD40 repeat protein